MSQDKAISRETLSPIPRPKRKWLRRLSILAGCLLVLFALWGILNLWMGSAFQREVDALRARGEPTSLAEMAPRKPLPPDQDAAVLIRRAISIYDANVKPLLDSMETAVKAAGYSWDTMFVADDIARHPELMNEFPSHVAAILDAAGPLVTLLRKARGLEFYDLDMGYSAPYLTIGDLNAATTRNVARLCLLLAVEAHRRGDDAEAAEHIRDCFTLSRHAAAYPVIIGELVAIAVEAVAEGLDPVVLHRLRIGREEADPARRSAKELMEVFLDANRPRERLVRCLVGDRAVCCTEIGAVLRGTASYKALAGDENAVLDNSALRVLCRPAMGSDAAGFLRGMSTIVAAAGEENWPSAVGKLSFPPPPQSQTGKLLHPFTPLDTYIAKVLQLHFRGVAGLRLAGAAIAVRMYELDKGRPLARLEDLVPDYLPVLPKDPFDANGGPIRMGRWGGRELLYSIGQVGSDLGGQYGPDPNESPYWHFLENKYNWPYFLRGDGPRERIVKRTPQTSPAGDAETRSGDPTEGAPKMISP